MSKFKAAIFDWAGTMIDFGSFAPMGAFVETFQKFGVAVTIADARKPMGLPKRAHISAMLAEPHIAAGWLEAQGTMPDETAIDQVYTLFVPLNESVVSNYCKLVPGALEAVHYLKARGMKIGSTTGYTRSIMERVLPLAAAQGYQPDNLICADDLALGRPTPIGMYKCFVDLLVYPPSVTIKVDDTEPGIAEGVAAGSLTIGVTLSGNEAGLTETELAALAPSERAELHRRIGDQLKAAGADHVIETVADLPRLLDRIDP